MLKYFRHSFIAQPLALLVLATLLVDLLYPSLSTAAPGGPNQVEFSTKPAVGDNMVNLFTGDFSYSIPLMEIDGFPVTIGYNAGITMEQEASWVGLGWNLNFGSINRQVRGIPDDFSERKINDQHK